MQSLRVMQLASGDLWAGAEVQFFTLCSELQQRADVELFVAVLNEGALAEQLRKAGVDVVVLDERKLSAPAVFFRLCALIRQRRPQVLHTHRFKENVLGGIAAALSGVPSLRTVHGAQELPRGLFDLRRQAIHWLDVCIGRFVQKWVVAVTEDLRCKLVRDFPPSQVLTVPNGVALDAIDVVAPVDLDGGIRIGIVGRLTEVKRVDLFLQMAKWLLDEGSVRELRFFAIGEGPLKADLQQQAQLLGIAESVTFTGHVAPAVGWIKALDVLVMCSDHEGLPMTLLEAMRARTAIVAHRVGGLEELLGPGDCAELVSEHSAVGYGRAVLSLLSEPSRTQARRDNGWRYVTQHLSATANAERFVALYRELAVGL